MYVKLCNYFQIAYGEGIKAVHLQFASFLFEIWVSNFKTYNAMQFLDRQGIINLSQEFSEKISMQFLIPSKVIRYMSLNCDEEIILAILHVSWNL
jgi:ATP-dependent DNA helicase RecQ